MYQYSPLTQRLLKFHSDEANDDDSGPFPLDKKASYTQTPYTNRLFVIGGFPAFNLCSELKLVHYSSKTTVKTFKRANTIHMRASHSTCLLSMTKLVVTGSTISDQASRECEIYDVTRDAWRELPSLTTGRHSHGSCKGGGNGSGQERIYIFSGYSLEPAGSRDRMNKTIECLKLAGGSATSNWYKICIKNSGNIVS